MIVLSEEQALQRASFDVVLDAVRRALIAAASGSGTVNPVVIGHGLEDCETFSIKSGAARDERIVGLKVGAYWPGNRTVGLPCHGSSILLLNPATGRLMAVVEASVLNGLRTAAADAAAAQVLARSDATTLTVVGAGNQALHEARAICAVRPIEHIFIISRTAARAAALRDLLAAEVSATVETASMEVGCRAADILVTATPSRAPLFDSAWLKPGVHVATMGSDQRGKQELPVDLLRRARLFCDLPAQSLSIGEYQHISAEVESSAIHVQAIGDVLAARAPGRQSSDEITVFDSSGLALQDMFVARALLERDA